MATLKDIIEELLKQKINIDDNKEPNNNEYNDHKLINNQQIFNKLSTYLPTISINNLESFINDTYEELIKLNHKVTFKPDENNIDSFQYNLNNQFFDTINENSLKYNSIIRKDQEQKKQSTNINNNNNNNNNHSTNADKNIKDLSKCYSSLYYLFYINLFKILLKLKKPQDFQNLLNEYYLDDLETDSDNDDEKDYLEEIKEKEQKHLEKIKEINNESIQEINNESIQEINNEKIKDIEKEDIYEPFENVKSNDDDDIIFFGGKENIIENWDIVSKKLQSIMEPISYDHISDDSIWEDYSILEDIEEISRLLISNTHLKLQELLPNFIYLLRDRMIHKPNDIQYILPLVFKILEISNPNDINENEEQDEIKKYLTPFQFKTILSLLSSLALTDQSVNPSIVTHYSNNNNSISNNKSLPISSINCLSKYIYQLLPYLVDRIAFWNSIPNDQFKQINTSKLEFESISNLIYFYSENPLKNIDGGLWSKTIIHKGILSQFIAIICYKLLISPTNSGIDILLDKLCKLCIKSNLLSQFIQKVPEFMNLVLMNQDFIQQFPQYHLIWIFNFKCCYQLEIKNTTIQSPTTNIRNNKNIDEGVIAEDIDDNIKSFVEKLENEYQSTSFNENENKKLEQLDIIFNIFLEAKNKISNKELTNKLFNNDLIQSLFSKYERQIVSIKINQHKEQQQQSNTKRTKIQKKSFELFNFYLNLLRDKLKSLSVSNKKK